MTKIRPPRTSTASPGMILSFDVFLPEAGVIGFVADRADVGRRPVAKERLAVNIFFGNESPDARVARIVAVVAHHEKVMVFDVDRRMIAAHHVEARVEIRLDEFLPVDENTPATHLDLSLLHI